jgi:integrase
MVTVKTILKKDKNQAGGFPLVIRITKDRKSLFISTGQYLEEKYWDEKNRRVKKSHPTSGRLNNYLKKQESEIYDLALTLIQSNPHVTASQIKQLFLNKTESSDFFAFANQHLQHMKDRNRINQFKIATGRLKIWKEYVKQDKLSLETITVRYLEQFETYLQKERKVSPRTVMNYFILIRTIYNRAMSQGVIDRKYYPFGKGKIKIKLPESEKVGLNKEEVRELEELKDITPAQNHARLVWLLSFYLAGVRVGDLLQIRKKDVLDGRLYYRMSKNQKLVSLKIPQKALDILNHYKLSNNDSSELVLPDLNGTNFENPERVNTRIKTINRNLNRHLENICQKLSFDKKISMHIARHTFGSIAGGSIPIQVLQKLYRHSSITTTVNYQRNFINEETDDALDSVINF